MKIGFSTGCFYKFLQPTSKEAVKIVRDLDSDVIELNASCLERIEILKDFSKDDFQSFKHFSLHGPGHRELEKFSNNQYKEILDKFEKAYQNLKFSSIVFHPSEWIINWSLFKDYSFQIAFENMDWRHSDYINVEKMKNIFKERDFKMVLDLNHCYTLDKSMKLAKDLFNAYQDRISHYHVSGFIDYDKGENWHAPLFKSKPEIADLILKSIYDLDKPIIIESVFQNKEEAKKELDYIKSVLR